ncbi:MAG: DUF2089 family protein [Legionellaceae bacterium]|nr:DUF2089 family protein [Legionellaceae bacterium]
MSHIITKCPSCDSSKLKIKNIECSDCSTVFSGAFDIPSLLKLPKDDLQFVFDFVKCSGSLKEMARQQGVSYPTLRNRLNTLIEALETMDIHKDSAKTEILELVEKGQLSAKEAASMLIKL